MPGREPRWWYGPSSQWQARLLAPAGHVVGRIAAARLGQPNSYRARLPVICVGNFTAGGSGKTPLALLIARVLRDDGREPWFLSRGYGGRLSGPVRVNAAVHGSADVGDEPLLLAATAPTIIARDRAAGARAIEAAAADTAVIVMDDGLQNPSLAKDLSIAVVSRERGLGNGRVIPAGPLRAPLAAQIGLANIIVISGPPTQADHSQRDRLAAMTHAPILRAVTCPADDTRQFNGRRVVAYAGIANPERFFTMLENAGAMIVERHAFGDHHVFSDAEARGLIDAARRTSADLVTTEKDLARLSGSGGAAPTLRAHSRAFAIAAVIEDQDDLAVFRTRIREAVSR